VVLALGGWEGSFADDVVARWVIEHYLGYKVQLRPVTEAGIWQSLAQGSVSADLEVWGESRYWSIYVATEHQVVPAGSLGIVGGEGWFVPAWLAAQHPALETWQGLARYWRMFVTPQSAPWAQLIGAPPAYRTEDSELVAALRLPFRVVWPPSSSDELSMIAAAYRTHQPIVFNWYTPQYEQVKYPVVQVALPPYRPGCTPSLALPCGYPKYPLYKLLSPQLAREAPPVAQFVKRFSWTAADQDEVAYDLAVDHLSAGRAASSFVEAHKGLLHRWLSGPSSPPAVPIVGT
jgi:glycine betaine/proline transport system substrate-binding protein